MDAAAMGALWLSDWTANLPPEEPDEPRYEYARVAPKSEQFSHEHAHAISRWALGAERSRMIIIDLSDTQDATTAAFAQLVVLRRALLRDGRDLCLAGLKDRTQHVYKVNRLEGVLPKQ